MSRFIVLLTFFGWTGLAIFACLRRLLGDSSLCLGLITSKRKCIRIWIGHHVIFCRIGQLILLSICIGCWRLLIIGIIIWKCLAYEIWMSVYRDNCLKDTGGIRARYLDWLCVWTFSAPLQLKLLDTPKHFIMLLSLLLVMLILVLVTDVLYLFDHNSFLRWSCTTVLGQLLNRLAEGHSFVQRVSIDCTRLTVSFFGMS